MEFVCAPITGAVPVKELNKLMAGGRFVTVTEPQSGKEEITVATGKSGVKVGRIVSFKVFMQPFASVKVKV